MGRGKAERRLGVTPEKETEMTTETRGRRIVVGYDGSPASRAALARAADRAGEDGHIYIVHAYSVPADYIGAPNYQGLLDRRHDRAPRHASPRSKKSRAPTSRASPGRPS